MDKITYKWTLDQTSTRSISPRRKAHGPPYHFGDGDQMRFVEVKEFWLVTATPGTQAAAVLGHLVGDRRVRIAAAGTKSQ